MNEFAPGLKKGDVVAAGQLIGYVGTTGKSTGPHLHYELRYGGLAVDAPATIPRGETALGPSEKSIHQRNLTRILETQ
jgi:murein DD-endopeptidase MepM/ murein hydrolase activator NlpD